MTAYGRKLLPADLEAEIEAAITASRATMDKVTNAARVDDVDDALVIKYTALRYGRSYRDGTSRELRTSETVGYTWGHSVYVTPVSTPLSNAIYGRAGVVARFDPAGWRSFDATEPRHERLYVRWLMQQPLFREVVVTVRSDYINHLLRNEFREQFHIDCVIFHPDELDRGRFYTQPDDIWLAVAEFTPSGRIVERGKSHRFTDPRLVVLVEEEFVTDVDQMRDAVLNLRSHNLSNALLQQAIGDAYAKNNLIRVGA